MIHYITLLFYQYASVKKRLCNIMCRVIVVHVCYRSTRFLADILQLYS